MLAECPEGSGSKDFFDWIKPLSKGCLDDLLAEVDFNGKDVYVIPYGGSVLPQTKEAYERICREAEENGGAK